VPSLLDWNKAPVVPNSSATAAIVPVRPAVNAVVGVIFHARTCSVSYNVPRANATPFTLVVAAIIYLLVYDGPPSVAFVLLFMSDVKKPRNIVFFG